MSATRHILRRIARRAVGLAAVVVYLAAPASSARTVSDLDAPSALPSNRPNILLIVTDDQPWSTFERSLMPTVFGELVDEVPSSRGAT